MSSRTINSIKNSIIALLMYFINLIVQFLSRKIFLDKLGTEILGLNTTVTNLLQFLNLAELGIGVAISFALYKPLAEKDENTIKEICTVQGIMYKRIGYFIIIGAIVLLLFFPLIFKKMHLPLWYAYASFVVLLFSSLLSYFVNYKQIVLSANQQNYKIILNFKAIMSIKVVFQMIFIYCFNNGYIWWLIWETIFAIIGSVSIDRTVKKEFPYLSKLNTGEKFLLKKYPHIVKKTKEVFFHKISGFVLTQVSPLIIYALLSMSMVAIYGNYMLILSGIYSLLNAFFNGMTASVGNLVAENNVNKSLKVFHELFSCRYLLITVICGVLISLSNPFITLWIGKEYLLNQSSVLLIVIILYINTTRTILDSFVYACGLFQDIWAAFAEIILNIGLSIILGLKYGLNGILLGVVISLFLIYVIWKPWFLFKVGLKIKYSIYLRLYLKHLFIGLLIIIANNIIFYPIIHFNKMYWFKFISLTIGEALSMLITMGVILYILDSGMKAFILRCKKTIHI